MSRACRLTLLAAVVMMAPARAQDWVMLEANGFTVVSDLDERDTRQWAEEFEGFLTALHRLLPLNRRLLPPLTAIVFKRSGGFAPYRLRTESGLVGGNAGIFINSSTWSVIGMPGSRSDSDDFSTTYHEAVHWFMSADPTRYPLWFSEGIAELFSTFDIADGEVTWARPIPNHLDFLRTSGLQPMEEFLEVSQDQAMHVNATYYSQAWLFVHYLTFGRPDGPGLLSRFLIASRDQPALDAFRGPFEIEPEAMDELLRDYAGENRFMTGSNPVDSANESEFAVMPAPPEEVEIALARLALGTGNFDLLETHLARVRSIAPHRPEPWDIEAAWRAGSQADDIESLVDEAIDRGSTDARTWELKGIMRLRALRKADPPFSSTALAPADAREIADHLSQSIRLRPLNRNAFRLLADVLYSVETVRESDNEIFAIGAIAYPAEAAIPLGRAALALQQDQPDEALRLVDLALSDNFELAARERGAAQSLRLRLERLNRLEQ